MPKRAVQLLVDCLAHLLELDLIGLAHLGQFGLDPLVDLCKLAVIRIAQLLEAQFDTLQPLVKGFLEEPTAVRSLESAAAGGELRPFEGDTRLFIHPGYRFRVVDAMVTNFHLPESTLLMLVSAFCGRETVLAAYAHAVAARYRFFSYGDAMFLTPHPTAARLP